MSTVAPIDPTQRPNDLAAAVRQWFTDRNFTEVEFRKRRELVNTVRDEHVLAFMLKHRPDYRTFFGETVDGALIVFEVKVDGEHIFWDGHCPLLVFAVWTVKLSFKPRAPILKYRAEGYRVATAFCEAVRWWHHQT